MTKLATFPFAQVRAATIGTVLWLAVFLPSRGQSLGSEGPIRTTIQVIDQTHVRLAWPTSEAESALDWANSISSTPSWRPVSTEPDLEGDVLAVRLELTPDPRFFRVREIAPAGAKPTVGLVPSSVRKICQLTGENDRERGIPAFNQTQTRFGFFGTDLGSSFEHDGRLWFLFGDTWPGPGPASDTDCVAWTQDTNPEPGIHLNFLTQPPGHYRSPTLRDAKGNPLGTGGFEVPIAGFSAGGRMFIFHSTDAFVEKGGDGGLDAFWQGSDNAIGGTWANPGVDNGNWRRPFPVSAPGAARPGAPILAIARFGDALDLFWIGNDGAVATTWANPRVDGANWHLPFPISPPGAARKDSALAAITRLDGALDVFWIGSDGAVATTWASPRLDGGNWHPPFPITPPQAARAGSPLVAITRLDGALDVFWIGSDGAVGTTWANPKVAGGQWHPPFPITPVGATSASSKLAMVTRLDGALDAFWTGPDGAIATTWANPRIDNGIWHAPFPISSTGAAIGGSPVAAITRFNGALDVFWIGPDRAVATAWANPDLEGGRWHAPFPITPPRAARNDPPLAVVTRFNGALDVFWIGPDGASATTWANPSLDAGAWHAPFPITPAGAARSASSLAAVTRRNGGQRTLMGRTVLASAVGNNPTDLVSLYDASRLDQGGRFINIACPRAPKSLRGLPFNSPSLLAFGSGRYRDSDVFLGAVPLNEVENPNAWRFLTGWQTGSTLPVWGPDQRAAAPLFSHPEVGELSVSWIPPLGVWLMLYNSSNPRGIVGRVATKPWGPWSDVFTVFNPGWAGLGYGHFMHAKDVNDGLADPGRIGEWGGEYGPYIIDRYTQSIETGSTGVRQARIYFILSTWNPYNTVLMTATLQRHL